eukprot:m.426186 g.426186  ORF g.426186 m.426186 type:complete len:51 (+) comp56694_c0_seq1:316-468(+)
MGHEEANQHKDQPGTSTTEDSNEKACYRERSFSHSIDFVKAWTHTRALKS